MVPKMLWISRNSCISVLYPLETQEFKKKIKAEFQLSIANISDEYCAEVDMCLSSPTLGTAGHIFNTSSDLDSGEHNICPACLNWQTEKTVGSKVGPCAMPVD